MVKLNTVDTLRTHGNLNARPGHCHCKHSSEQSGQLEKLYKHAFQGSPIRDAIIGCATLEPSCLKYPLMLQAPAQVAKLILGATLPELRIS